MASAAAVSVPGQLLAGKWCVVTGASRGIGRSIAEALAREHANLVLVSRDKSKLQEVQEAARKLGPGQVEICPVDLKKGVDAAVEVATTVQDIVKRAGSKGALYALINNAGMAPNSGQGPLEGDLHEWADVMNVNLMVPIALTQQLVPHMISAGEGLLVNICSVAAIEPIGKLPLYAASKHGLRGWSRSCYDALRSQNIKVLTINPGMVATDMATGGMPNADPKRMIQPEDIAEAVMMAVRFSSNAVPAEITIRPVRPVMP